MTRGNAEMRCAKYLKNAQNSAKVRTMSRVLGIYSNNVRMQRYKQFDYSRTQLDDRGNTDKMHNVIQKSATIRGRDATIRRQDDIEHKMRTMRVGEGKDSMYSSFFSRRYFTAIVILRKYE